VSTPEVAAGTAADRRLSPRQRKALVAGGIGNTVEYVDWAIYATFAPIFAAQFFAPGNDTAALLSTLAVFAAGFVMRPIGGAVLGAYADRYGRKKGLSLSIGIMAGASLLIAVSPTYAQVGLLAPVVLLVARLAQGFSAGGEFGSSVAYMVESAAPRRRAFAGSWQQVSVGAGTLIAAGMGTVLTSTLDDAALESWGWRLAFGLGALLGVVGLWLRVAASETDAFAELDGQQAPGRRRNPVVVMVREHPAAALRVAGITVAGTLIYYMWVSYMPAYAHLTTGIPLRDALLANSIALVVFLVALPFGGILSDRIGRKPTMLAFAGGFVVFAWPAFHFLGDSFGGLLVIQLVGMLLIVGYSANCAAVMAEQFPAEVRSAGVGLSYALAVAVFGGTVPYVTTWMSSNGLGDMVWLYIALAALVGVGVYATMPETKGRPLP
jgi:MHS family alpha-ketoglutarate permease-like MFS transporter